MQTSNITSKVNGTAFSSAASSEDMGKFLLRAGLAILILFHGVAKLLGGH